MNFITKIVRIGQDSLINYEYNAENDEKTYRFIAMYYDVSEPKLVKSSRPCNINEINLWMQSQDKIDWSEMSKYPNVVNLHEHPCEDKIKIDWSVVSQIFKSQIFKLPEIFEYDYEAIHTHFRPILQGIIQNRFHPKNIKYFDGWGYTDFEEFKE